MQVGVGPTPTYRSNVRDLLGIRRVRIVLEELIELTGEDAETFDCVQEIRHAREILKRGTSAHRQLAIYEAALTDGADKRQALEKVVDFLIAETVAGI